MPITWMQLQAAREAAGLTQAGLAAQLGVSVRTIVNWEANGVPRKSEHKVIDVLGDLLETRNNRAGLGRGISSLISRPPGDADDVFFPRDLSSLVVGEASDEELLRELLERARRRRMMFEGSLEPGEATSASNVSSAEENVETQHQRDQALAAKKRSKNRGEVNYD